MAKQCVALIISAFLFFSTSALGDAEGTTWRVGDLIRYRAGCHTVEDMTRIAELENPYELAGILLVEGKCFIRPFPIWAFLEEWISGPYIMPGNVSASIWRLLDQLGDVKFGLIRDEGGSHPARRGISI